MLGIRANKTMKNIINNEPNASNAANDAAAARRESRTMRSRPNLTVANDKLEFANRTLNLKPYVNASRILRENTRNNLAILRRNRNRTRRLVKNQKNQNKFFKAIANKKVKIAAKEEARLKEMEPGIMAMQIKHAHNLEVEKQRWAKLKNKYEKSLARGKGKPRVTPFELVE
jgi:hypothetical protein